MSKFGCSFCFLLLKQSLKLTVVVAVERTIGKRTQRVRTQQQGRPDHRRWTAVYDVQPATVRKRGEDVSGRRDRPYTGLTGAHRRARGTQEQ